MKIRNLTYNPKVPLRSALAGGRVRVAASFSGSTLQGIFKTASLVVVQAALMSLLASSAPAETVKFDSLATLDGRTYQKVEVIGHDAVGIKIKHEGGIARLPFEKLPKDLQSRFGYDPAKAAALRTEENQRASDLQRQLDEDARRQKQVQPRPQVEPRDETDSNPDSGGEFDFESPPGEAEIAKLEIYVIKMKGKIAAAQSEAADLDRKATMESFKMKEVRTVSPSGTVSIFSKPDKGAQFRLKSMRRRAEEIRRKIAQASILVKAAEAKIAKASGQPPSE